MRSVVVRGRGSCVMNNVGECEAEATLTGELRSARRGDAECGGARLRVVCDE